MFKLRSFFIITAFFLLRSYLPAQPSRSNAYTDSLQHAFYNTKNDTNKIYILYELANAYSKIDSAVALKYAQQCLQLSKLKNWQKGIGLADRAMGMMYYILSDYNTSIQYYKKGYAVFRNISDEMNAARLLSNIGDDYGGSGLYTQSLENYLAALKLFEKLNNKDGASAEYNNIGIDYYDLLQYDKAIENYNYALQIDKTSNDEFAIASDLDNIAAVYIDENKYDSANMYNIRAVQLFEEINDLPALGRTYINHGNILLKQHDAASAYYYYNRSLNINKKLNITVEIASCNRALGNLYLTLANDTTSAYKILLSMRMSKPALYAKAKNYLLTALRFGKQSNDISRLMDYNLLLSSIEEQLDNYKNALIYHKEYSAYKDSIFNDANRKKVEAMEQERLAEVKDQQIQLLQQQKVLEASEFKRKTLVNNVVLFAVITVAALTAIFILLYNRRKKIQFDKQVMEVEMKALRAQMNPHFIFNSLHSINNYIIENDKEKASAYLIKFASLMRFILENSREQEVSVETDLQALELYMQLEALQSKKTFTYNIETDEAIDKENSLIPPMLLQPFVENAILHGIKHKENGNIKINVYKQDEMICFEIEDNGSGLQESSSDQQKKHKSLAFKITDERLSILNQLHKAKASVHISNIIHKNNITEGVKVKLLLPLKVAF